MSATATAPAVAAPAAAEDRWETWDNFLQTRPDTGFMQSSWWADFRATLDFGHFATILRDSHRIVGGALVQKYASNTQNYFYYIQDGPVLPDDEAAAAEVFEAILAAIDERRRTDEENISHLRIEPRWERVPGFVRGFTSQLRKDRYREPRNTLCIDLRHSEDDILGQMKPKGRYNIRVAQRHGVRVVEDSSEKGLEDFLGIYEDTATRQKMWVKPPEYFDSLLSILTVRGHGSIFFAEYEGRRLAAALVIFFGPRATYFYGGSLDIDRNVMAPYLLHFEIMRKAKAMGHEWYDLWGVAPQNQPDHPWQNVSVFKRKFGGSEITLVPTLDYIYDDEAYVHPRGRRPPADVVTVPDSVENFS